MDPLNPVSETALITLRARAIEAGRKRPVLHDEMGRELLRRLRELLPPSGSTRLLDRRLPSSLTNYIALRAAKFDELTRAFLAREPGGLVVSLGCGFDTRYWRVSSRPGSYVEVDLPEVIALKQQLLEGRAEFEMIGASVLEDAWLERIRSLRTDHVLFLAEGLFMYLDPPDAIRVLRRLAESFTSSELVLETVHHRFTRGLWKKLVEHKMRRALGSEAGTSYRFGLRAGTDLEDLDPRFELLEEWSYLDDDRVRPRLLRLFRGWKLLTRSQWTVRVSVGRGVEVAGECARGGDRSATLGS